MTERFDVLIVGAGLAGAYAARRLIDAGLRVCVLDAGAAPGGKLGRGADGSGGEMPIGPSTFLGRHAVFFRALARAGLTEDAVRVGTQWPRRYIVRGGRLRPLVQHPLSLVLSRAVPTSAKVAFLRDAALGRSRPRAGDTLDALLRRALGDAFADGPLAAVVNGVWAGDAAVLDAEACFPDLVAAANRSGSVARALLATARPAARPMGARGPGGSANQPAEASAVDGPRPGTWTLGGGLPRLAAGLLRGADVRTGTRASVVGPDGSVTLEDGRVVRADQVLVATEAPAAAELLRDSVPAASRALRGFRTAPVAVVRWRAAPGGPRGFGWLAPPGEGLCALGDLFVSDILEDDARLHASFFGGARTPERAAWSERDLGDALIADLRRVGAHRVEQIVGVDRWRHAIVQPTAAHGARVAEAAAATEGTRIWLAGAWQGAGAMKDALLSGEQAAARILGEGG